jgi:two-component system, response regulator
MNDKYVLLVEDNPDDVTLTEIAFKKSQITNKLVVVVDGQEALDFLFGHGQYAGRDPQDKPALVLLDLKLPLVSGMDVLKEMRADSLTSRIPVVVLTSSMEDNDQVESCKLGANDFIRKPTGFSHFVDIIQQIKVKWLT